MKSSQSEEIEKNSQVYYSYGRLSNSYLLKYYGIALEYNKYNHDYLRIPLL